jgi:hypothetical protein
MTCARETRFCSRVMNVWRQIIRWVFVAVVTGTGLGLMGCKTESEASNDATRPWNAPKAWENGLPSGMWERP